MMRAETVRAMLAKVGAAYLKSHQLAPVTGHKVPDQAPVAELWAVGSGYVLLANGTNEIGPWCDVYRLEASTMHGDDALHRVGAMLDQMTAKPKPEKFVTATGFEVEDVYASAESLGLDVTHEQAQAFLREWHDKIDERADAAGRAVIDDELEGFINGG